MEPVRETLFEQKENKKAFFKRIIIIIVVFSNFFTIFFLKSPSFQFLRKILAITSQHFLSFPLFHNFSSKFSRLLFITVIFLSIFLVNFGVFL